MSAACAAAGMALVLDVAPGCDSRPAYAIMPPNDAGADVAPPRTDGPPIYSIMPPKADGPGQIDRSIAAPDGKRDGVIIRTDGPPIYPIIPPQG